MDDVRQTVLCISSYEKGKAFLREAAALGCDVVLLTAEKLKDASWPREALADLWLMPDRLTPEQVLNTVTYHARHRRIDRVVALDEFDLEAAALIREHMRLPGMGQSTTRFFRDKLAMRQRAQRAGVLVPEFTPVLHYDDLREFMASVPGPWVLKPRSSASAIGIRKIHQPQHLWPVLEELGDEQSHYLLERFVPGEVFHVDGVTWKQQVRMSAVHQYGAPPMKVMHEGGVFTTRSIHRDSLDARMLTEIHEGLVPALGMMSGVTHTEFIKAEDDGEFYFLETAARVGGAYISDVIEHSTGTNLWREWARIEVASMRDAKYDLPRQKGLYAGSVLCLAKMPEPDLSGFDAPEVVDRLKHHHHAGLIVASESAERVNVLVKQYAGEFLERFCATAPAPADRPTA
ncbi:ATP-grasp domain-containing protein [Terriglobus tenax]|uniref:ATP-grasp domain-containing protein n=1 Tax=Terriglobus tenax TaxID=1111115 RepID=UPI0021E06076|nr:ATP-grasp domain-containing protein [Terriglobus tenax]